MESKVIVCEHCNQVKTQYFSKYMFCQTCYRKLLEEYSFYDYKISKEKLNETSRKICKLLIEDGVPRGQIYKKVKLNKTYVQQIIKKYTIRVNQDGKERPF